MLGSCFCFSQVRHHEKLHVKLFATITHDLADGDLCLQQILAEVIANDHLLRDMADIAEQWKKLILKPLSQLGGPLS